MASPTIKDQQVSHWDLDYMTDAQRAAYLAEQRRRRHVDKATRTDHAVSSRSEAGSGVHPRAWVWTGIAAALVAAGTGLLWLLTLGPLG